MDEYEDTFLESLDTEGPSILKDKDEHDHIEYVHDNEELFYLEENPLDL